MLGDSNKKINEIKNAPVSGCMNIGEKVLFKGDVLNAESVNIDGSFEGKIETSNFILGKSGFFKGDVIQRRGSGLTETFTIRKISSGIGVERIFPVHSPGIENIEINKLGKVRRARIFYMRQRTGKSARIKQKRT